MVQKEQDQYAGECVLTDIRQLSAAELREAIVSIGEKAYRTDQIYTWLAKGITQFEDMRNLPGALIEKLKQQYRIDNVKIVSALTSQDGTVKLLNALYDGEIVESVFMRYKHGNSACLSTQVGCNMKCAFCASTVDGCVRNVTAGEMLGQIYAMQNHTGEHINNVVLMGSGEPLDNYDETLKFIHLACDEKGLNLSGRAITLSTCGLAPQIRKLAEEQLQITLAISLHNAIDEERREIMPVTKAYSIDNLMGAVAYYIEKTHRRVTFEYAMIDGVNDTMAHADALGRRLRGMLVHVNLIPVNAVKENQFFPPQNSKINVFMKRLVDKYNINTTVRRELGSDINAACGQLRRQHLEGDGRKAE
ncbi:MAG: rRNA (adenine2503-C2)-methyltransferase [Clostridiales bacterium]|nr:rRNA (adenine2503-C2)-methyltransferase [Clostridiales bacterium]